MLVGERFLPKGKRQIGLLALGLVIKGVIIQSTKIYEGVLYLVMRKLIDMMN